MTNRLGVRVSSGGLQRPPMVPGMEDRERDLIHAQHGNVLGAFYNYDKQNREAAKAVGLTHDTGRNFINGQNFGEVLAHAHGVSAPPRGIAYGIDRAEPRSVAITGLSAPDAQRMLTSLNRQDNVARLVGEPGAQRLVVPVEQMQDLIQQTHQHAATLSSQERVSLGVPINGVTYDRDSAVFRSGTAMDKLPKEAHDIMRLPTQGAKMDTPHVAHDIMRIPPQGLALGADAITTEPMVSTTVAGAMRDVDARSRTLGDGGRALNAQVQPTVGARSMAHMLGVENVRQAQVSQQGENLEVRVGAADRAKLGAMGDAIAKRYGEAAVGSIDHDRGVITIPRHVSGQVASDLAKHTNGLEQNAPGLVNGMREESRRIDLAHVRQTDSRGVFTAVADESRLTGMKPEDVLASQRTGIAVDRLQPSAATVTAPQQAQAPAMDFSKLAGVAQAAAALQATGAKSEGEARQGEQQATQVRSAENVAGRQQAGMGR